MGLKSLVRKGRPHPVLAIRTQLSAHLRENLKTLGLKRVSKTLTVTDLLNTHDDEPTPNGKAERPKGECHCGKDGHALNSVNCPIHGANKAEGMQ